MSTSEYDVARTEGMMKIVEEMNVAANRLAMGAEAIADSVVYGKTYSEGSCLNESLLLRVSATLR